ncbi:MAG: hypothetical protein J0H48_01855 [Nitrosospira multiformis]|nr:hypothetical protein [Nitrosospira multiformis]
MTGLDEPGNEQECFIFALIEAEVLASSIVLWKEDIQRDRLSRLLRMSQEEGEVRALLSQHSGQTVRTSYWLKPVSSDVQSAPLLDVGRIQLDSASSSE